MLLLIVLLPLLALLVLVLALALLLCCGLVGATAAAGWMQHCSRVCIACIKLKLSTVLPPWSAEQTPAVHLASCSAAS
jgi:hypothetical protein